MNLGAYALAGAWGARDGPRLIRRALDSERAVVFAAIILADLVLLVFCAGAYVAVLVIGLDGPLWLRFLMLGSFLLAAAGAVVVLVEAASRRWWSRRRPGRLNLAPAPSGTPATAVPRSGAALVTPLALVFVHTAWCIAMAATTVRIWWLSTIFGLLGVAAASRFLPVVLGRVAAGGVFLTPFGIEHRFGVRTTFIPWDGLAVPQVGVPFCLQSRSRTRETWSFPIDVPMDVNDRVSEGIAVPTPYLALESANLVALLAMYAGRPRRQAHLGTSRSLEWQPWSPNAVVFHGDDSQT